MTPLWPDVRSAARSYRKTPAFTVVALLTLTLAIGATTAIFGLLDALLLRELPVRDPRGLVQISTTTPPSTYQAGLTYSMFERVSDRTDLFADTIGWTGPAVFDVEVDGDRTRAALWFVSGRFFAVLGIRAEAGRLLGPEDIDTATLDPAPVAVIGHRLWQQSFGGRPDAIGRRIRTEGHTFTVVGVAPAGFRALGWVVQPDVVLPLTAYPMLDSPPQDVRSRPGFWVRTTARVKPGVTIDRVRAALDVQWPALKADTLPPGQTPAQRDRFLSTTLLVQSAANGVGSSETNLRNAFTQPLVILLGIAGLILLIASVNLASLMLSRTAARSHEIGVRLALGASRWRVVRQILVEGVLLSAIGGVLGIDFALWISRGITAMILRDYVVPASLDVRPDGRLLLFALGLSICVGALFSLVPALRATRVPATELLKTGTRTATGISRPGRLLVGAQIALSLVLLTNAGLLVRSLQQIRSVDSGIRARNVFVAYPASGPGGYGSTDNDSYYPQVVGRLEAIPGVRRVAVSLSKPAGGGIGGGERAANARAAPDGPTTASLFSAVSPAFFDALDVPLRSGRDFTWRDNSRTSRVAIVSESLARRLFPNGAIGEHVRIGVAPAHQSLEVVGVAADAHLYDVKDPNLSAVYVPALQEPDPNGKCFVIRANGVSLADLNRAIEPLGREHVGSVQALAAITDGVLLRERLTAAVAAFFGGLALLLAAVGLYGLLSYGVTQRQKEIGIRMALGAEPRRILSAFVGEALAIALSGVAAGLAAALFSVRLVKSLLFGVTPTDPTALASAIVSLIAIAVVGALLPAARAARVDPVTALRAE